jgi:hypothetical protein
MGYNGRRGRIESLLVATQAEIDAAIGRNVYFGEILGKHSEEDLDLTREMFTKIEADQDAVAKLEAVLGATWSGYDPIVKLREQEAEQRAQAEEDAEIEAE